jgi:dGTP triphosphohydrolase
MVNVMFAYLYGKIKKKGMCIKKVDDMTAYIASIEETSYIQSNKIFGRLKEKTQVLQPEHGLEECAKDRLTHSQEVATSSRLMAASIAQKLGVDPRVIDYQYAIYNVSLLHDIGQAPFGHDGQAVVDDFICEQGLIEGFDDNNNNLTAVEKHQIEIRDYTKVSLIKYPDELYDSQKAVYLPLLQKHVDQDKAHYAEHGIHFSAQKRTMACEIMDEADRNSYVCSDLADFFCLGNSVSGKEILALDDKLSFDVASHDLRDLHCVVTTGSKTVIKKYFNDLKNRFNNNWKLTEAGLVCDDKQLHQFREYLGALEMEYFIKPLQGTALHQAKIDKLKGYCQYVVDNNYFPSRHYKQAIEAAPDKQTRLRHIADMIGETTDYYVLNYESKIPATLLKQGVKTDDVVKKRKMSLVG